MKNPSGTRQLDMLHGPIWNKIPMYALPVAATAVLEQLFNASDVAVVGNFTGSGSTLAVAAVGANSSIISLVVNLFTGVALGANVVIANAVGRQDETGVRKAVHTSIILSLLAGFLVAVLGELAAAPLLGALSVPEDVLPLALTYLRIYLIGMPVILLYNFEAAIFRSVGETKTPLIVLMGSGVLNVILNLFFVAVLKMNVEGVAIATVISNAVSAAVLYIQLRRTDENIHVEPRELGLDRTSLGRILRIGLPAGLQSAVFSISNIVIQAAINSLGTAAMAANSAAYNIEIMNYYTLNAFSQACTTFVGQNHGAHQPDRCRRTLALCLAEGAVVLTVVVSLMIGFGKPLLSIFDSNPEVIAMGYIRLVLVLVAHFFSLVYETVAGYLRGFGISLVPAILTILGVCGIRIAWIQFVFPTSPSFRTIMNVYPISLAATAVLMLAAFIYYRPARRLKRALSAEK